jgi:putative ATPase
MYEPLASRMRPRNLDDFAGQEKLVGENGSLRMMFDGGELGSMVFWGPPGCGKTTLAQMLAERSDLNFKPFSAVLSGIKEVREAMQQAKSDREQSQRPTLSCRSLRLVTLCWWGRPLKTRHLKLLDLCCRD